MFHPNLGRWMQLDPIGFDGGDVNLYGDVGNNPVRFADPSGLEKKEGYPRDLTPEELERLKTALSVNFSRSGGQQ